MSKPWLSNSVSIAGPKVVGDSYHVAGHYKTFCERPTRKGYRFCAMHHAIVEYKLREECLHETEESIRETLFYEVG
jgi:hypothetical protein